jgi:pimeloyl-ACP methyl ester carboxylesterase
VAVGAVALIGYSLGGLVALMAMEHRGVPTGRAAVLLSPLPPAGAAPALSLGLWRQGLGLLEPTLRPEPIRPPFEALAPLLYPRLPEAEAKELYFRTVPESGAALREISLGVSIDAGSITQPLLVMAGADDRLVPPPLSLKIAQKFHADYRMYPGHAHPLPLEPGWELLARDAARWLAEKLKGTL